MEEKCAVGKYELLMELHQGAMSTIYKGRDPKTNRLFAIKIPRFSDECEEEKVQEIRDRLSREAEVAGNLSHPGIIAIYEVGVEGDLIYMAMEFLEGESLETSCTKGLLLPLRRVLDIVAETADTLEYTHNSGVVRRNIKPANIMLLKDGTIKVTGFGIAESISASKTRTGILLGTPNYMSPEQTMGFEIDARSDIFSLGVVFFRLLTGELPFRGATLKSLFYQITRVRHPSVRELNPEIPAIVERIVDEALAKRVSRRYQRAGEMAEDIQMAKREV